MMKKMVLIRVMLGIYLVVTVSGCSSETDKKSEKQPKIHLVEISTGDFGAHAIKRMRTGTLRARKEVKIFNQEEGRITKLPFYEGDTVKTGDVVAKLDDKLLRAQLARSQATSRQAFQDVSRLKNLFKKKLVSDEELSRGETSLEVAKADEEILRTRLGYTTITPPFDGFVSARLTEPGNIADKFTHLLTIADPTSLITEVTLSELLLSKLKKDDLVEVQIDALGQSLYLGHISRIHPSLDPVTRRGTVEVELKPVPEGARPGQLCRVQFKIQSAERLTIPFKALRRDQQGEYVFVVEEDNKVKRIAVGAGLRIGERVEILTGIEQGMKVVTKGFLGLSPGKKVKIVQPATANSQAASQSVKVQPQ